MIFSLSRVSIYTEPFLTSHDFIGSQASQNKAILSVPSGVKFTIGLNTSTPASHLPSKMTLTRRITRQARAVPLDYDIISAQLGITIYIIQLHSFLFHKGVTLVRNFNLI